MIKQEDWVMIKSLKKQGLSKTEIARMLGIDRKTVSKHLSKDTFKKYQRKQMPSILDNFKNYIDNRLKDFNLTSFKLFEEIKSQGYTGKYGIVSAYVNEVKKTLHNKAYIRFETMPGQQAQVDWGYYGLMYDKVLRKTIKVYFFVMTLGYSRATYVEFFKDQTIDSFLKAHNNAFKFFGGYPKEILYDNLKSVVIKRAFRTKDSEFNKKFMDFAGYYGFNPILARPYKPTTKGKVESKVNYVKVNFLAGEEFNSLDELNFRVKLWLQKINNKHNFTTREIPFVRLKKENLISIENKKLFDLSISFYRKVQKDCHFSFEGNFYSVPYKFANKEIYVKKFVNNTIDIFYRDSKITAHALELNSKGKFITDESHIAELKKINCSLTNKFKSKKAKASPDIQDQNQVVNHDLIVYEGGAQYV